jgi:hypothetical protein
MKKFILALAATTIVPAEAAWVPAWSIQGGGTIYYDNATMGFSGPVTSGNPFIRATIFTDYGNAINSDQVCYPSGADCQWKKLNILLVYDWDCRNTVRLIYEKTEWDSGPSSQSYDPRRGGYNIPEPRQLVQKPGPVQPGGSYNIANDRSLMTVQAAVCSNWPRR